MKNKFWTAFLRLFLILITPALAAQQVQGNSSSYKWFDTAVGRENTQIFNGIEYIEQHVTINEHQKYFGSIYFRPGMVVYDGQPYYEVEMKYNVYDDLLLLRGTGSSPLQLHKTKVEAFNLDDKKFININADTTSAVEGFYEVLLETEGVSLLKKHTKKRKKFLDRSFTYFEFYDDTPVYAIARGEEYFPLNSRRELRQTFPNHSRVINRFYRERRKQFKNDPDAFMIELTKKLIMPISKDLKE